MSLYFVSWAISEYWKVVHNNEMVHLTTGARKLASKSFLWFALRANLTKPFGVGILIIFVRYALSDNWQKWCAIMKWSSL